MVMVEEKNRSNKKLKILLSAERLFAVQGYHKTTVEDIAKSAGIGKSTFYEYYSSKEELLKTSVSLISSCFFEIILDEMKKCSNAKEKINRLVYCCLLLSDFHNDAFNIYSSLVINDSFQDFSEYFRENFWDAFLKIIRNVFIEGMNEGSIVEEDADLLTCMFLGIVLGVMRNIGRKHENTQSFDYSRNELDGENFVKYIKSLPNDSFLETNATKITDIFFQGIGK